MLNIDDARPNVISARELHVKRMICYVNKKLRGKTYNCQLQDCEICKSVRISSDVTGRLLKVLKGIDINRIISGKPAELLQLHNNFISDYGAPPSGIVEKDKKSIEKIFNYKWFCDNDLYNSYHLCKQLDISTCVYCNRIYTTTACAEDGKHIIRPTLDHWFPKAKYPLLAISFYNLIPSCSPCNSSVKHMDEFTLNDHVHPYINKNTAQQYKMRSIYDEGLGSFKVSIDTTDKKIESTLAAMKIAKIYQHHQSELKDIAFLKQKYNRQYLQDLGKLLDKTLSEKDVYRLMFGVEYEEENMHKRPLSKLKKDILGIDIEK